MSRTQLRAIAALAVVALFAVFTLTAQGRSSAPLTLRVIFSTNGSIAVTLPTGRLSDRPAARPR